jgi:acetyl esterase/lipase
MLADDHEGKQVAKWYNDRGITAFILYYRLGFYSSGYTHPVPLMDASRAVKLVRAKANEFKIDPGKIGILGFSAGGHLASTIGTQYTKGDKNANDPIEKVSSRPDYLVLVYPVISFTAEYSHTGSSKSLLGPEPDKKLLKELSTDLGVTAETPPTFLVHTDEDDGVPSLNSISFYVACKKAGVPAELHIYEKGKHGLGMINAEEPVFSTWAERLEDWLKIRKSIE